jgi:hypothetical protein
MGVFVLLCLTGLFVGGITDSSGNQLFPGLSVFAVFGLIVGVPLMFMFRQTSIPKPDPVPEPQMFYTDAEIAARVARERAEEESRRVPAENFRMIAAAATAAAAAHAYQRNEQRHSLRRSSGRRGRSESATNSSSG